MTVPVTVPVTAPAPAPDLMPAAFIGHGSPMNALDATATPRRGGRSGEAVPRPRAILVVSAHWYINATAVTAMPQPRTIHDFFGFPQPLFDVDYPAPGLPGACRGGRRGREPDLGRPRPRQLGHRPRHLVGAGAHVPRRRHPGRAAVHQRDKPLDYHLELGARLAPLREQRRADRRQRQRRAQPAAASTGGLPDAGFDWAQRFDEDARALDARRPDRGRRARRATPTSAAAVPTPDHFLPLLYLAGLAGRRPTAAPTCSSTATPTARCR